MGVVAGPPKLKFWWGLSDQEKPKLCLDFQGGVVAHEDTIESISA